MTMKRLEKLRVGGTRAKMQLSIPVPRTPDGRVYRYSPNVDAHPRHFVMGDPIAGFTPEPDRAARMRYVPGTPGTVCLYSGTRADDAEFMHPDDRKAALKSVEHAAIQDMQDAFSDMLAGVARGSKALTYKPGPRANPPRPRFGRRDLMRLLVCDCCGRDYGVFAIALFCPDCGAPNLALHFAREAELVGQQIDLAEVSGKDRQELAYRLLGNAHEDVVTAFEATLKVAYAHMVPWTPGRVGAREAGRKRLPEHREGAQAFRGVLVRSVRRARRRGIRDALPQYPEAWHSLGVVDAKFAQHATEAKLGETVELVAADIRSFAGLCGKVIRRIDDLLAGQPLPPPTEHPEEQDIPAPIETIGDLGPEGTAVGRWICTTSKDGLPGPVDADALVAAFPGLSLSQLAEAVADLAEDGFVSLTHTISSGLPRVHAGEDRFLTFDPLVTGHDPGADALGLFPLVLAREPVDVRPSTGKAGCRCAGSIRRWE